MFGRGPPHAGETVQSASAPLGGSAQIFLQLAELEIIWYLDSASKVVADPPPHRSWVQYYRREPRAVWWVVQFAFKMAALHATVGGYRTIGASPEMYGG